MEGASVIKSVFADSEKWKNSCGLFAGKYIYKSKLNINIFMQSSEMYCSEMHLE